MSSPVPPSSPCMPTSPTQTTDDCRSTRRASTDSDSSIFSHFSLTRESEANLQAWEQAMLGTGNPVAGTPSPEPTTHAPLPVPCGAATPAPRRDFIDLATPSPEPTIPAPGPVSHGDIAPPRVWVVFRGRAPGLYDSLKSAEEQTEGFPNALSFSYTNVAHVGHDLDQFLEHGALPPYGSGPWVVYVGRSTGVFTELSDLKAAVDGFPRSHYVSCTSVQEATQIYSVFQTLLSTWSPPSQSQPQPQVVAGTLSNVEPAPAPSSSNRNQRGRRPFQPFLLDESIYYLPGHETWWVTWAAVYPGVYYGMDNLLAAGPIAGRYCSVGDQAEGFDFFHKLVQSRLVRKLPAPPS